VLIDGVDLRSIAPESLARHVGVVLQEPLLLDDSVRANLTLSAPDASEQDLLFATRIACINERIARLRDGYETPLGAGAARLSGGERQRLALARALVRRPRILLLDEATSSLDLATEARVHQNLSELGCTRVIVAHRLATVRDADRILVIEGGKIVQQGSYQQLLQSSGLFAQLVKSAEARSA
jgi:ABC-type bacteriocin/lantibiotic exporter with double-glycine peptidase domain